MGALEFVSPDAYAVGCMLTREPGQIADEIIAVLAKDDPEGLGKLGELERKLGLSVRDDLAAPLGGEILVAIDGPVLPKPAWKLVIAVDDQTRLQQTIEKLVTMASAELAAHGKPTLVLASETTGGTTFYTLSSTDGAVELHYTFSDGYWLIAAQKTILTNALAVHSSGMSLPTTAVFRGALPLDGQQQYSALGFVNAGTLAAAIASAIPSATTTGGQATLGELKKLLSETSAMALCVTAEPDRILLTSTGIDLTNPSRVLAFLASIAPAGGTPARQRSEQQRPGDTT